MIKRIAIVGTGKVADQLCRALLERDIDIVGAFSKTADHRASFSRRWSIREFKSIQELSASLPDLVLIAVADASIKEVSRKLSPELSVAHTSGSIPLNDLAQSARGVFYPLQTFSQEKEVDWTSVPICVEASDATLKSDLLQLGKLLSEVVKEISTEQRKFLHIAAVFACNFSNHMYAIAEQLMHSNNMDFDMLQPLIEETAEKIKTLSPVKAQTGPAQRKDQETMNAHLQLLAGSEKLKHLYGLISEQIIALQNGKKL